VISAVCLSFCLHDTATLIIETRRYYWADQSDEPLTSGGDLDTDSGSLVHFHQHCGVGDFRSFISISRTVTGRNDWHWWANESTTLRKWSVTESWLILRSGFEPHFWLKLYAFAEVCAPWALSRFSLLFTRQQHCIVCDRGETLGLCFL